MNNPSGNQQSVGQAYRAAARRRLSECHDRIGHCVGQLDDAQLWWRPCESMNSIANLILHLSGNLRQWLVAGVGGAADIRDRPREFAEREAIPKDELLTRLNAVVAEADAALGRCDEARLLERRRIQGFEGTVLSAIFGCLTHLNGHTQEIVHLTRLQLGDAYRFAWVPGTAEQGSVSPGETVAVRDAAFEEMPGHPLQAAPASDMEVLQPRQAAPVEAPAEEPADLPPRESPLQDYLLDLEQEFQDEQDEGKL